jgi:hypothetical protein
MSCGALVSGVRIEMEHLCPVEPHLWSGKIAAPRDVCWYICWYPLLRSLEKCHPINMIG